jgi:DNA-binding beta-propeller fold protein YncE
MASKQKWNQSIVWLALAVATTSGNFATAHAQTRVATGQPAPTFEVDPAWPKIPNGWTLGQVSSAVSDSKGNIWVLQRPRTVVHTGDKTGPPVLVFDQNGNYIKGWGGPGEGYDWPESEHGIYIDYKGFVWICGDGPNDQVLKFTQDGKFVLQIGHGSPKKSNADTQQMWRPAGLSVYPKTNELFVSDGYGNKRVIVFDADTGAFKRMWGAFGNKPLDGPLPKQKAYADPTRVMNKTLPADDPGPSQFSTVHDVKVSNDGVVYVADRGGQRVQIFSVDGKYQTQIWIDRWCEEMGGCGNGQTAGAVAFSPDPEQRFLYVMSRSASRVWVFDRKTLTPLEWLGSPGIGPGEFYGPHWVLTDPKGNIYVCEVLDGRRIHKFVLKGITTK